MIRTALETALAGTDLSADVMESVMESMLQGELTPAQISGLLVALRAKGESVHEIAAAARVMRRHAVGISVPPGLDPVDTCGTGGDGSNTFNISTAAALTAAAAGATVAKHGNRSVSSKSGSADVLEALGVRLDVPATALSSILESVGIAFMFAPAHHGATRHAVGPRRELGIRTLFNVLGPLTNPAGAQRQVMGVYTADLVAPIGHVLAELGTVHSLVVHGAGGIDEFSVAGPSRVAEVRGGNVDLYEIHPADVGLGTADLSELVGGEAQENAEILRSIFSGETSPRSDAVAFNAGAALYVAGTCNELSDGVALASSTLSSGKVLDTLAALIAATEAAAS
ncbi:MAG: anthranilate phosphoribosyltransferase [Myxococcota bacterium]|nr:anthranilate phosphoribosyltransferase [Myxococcota bacterium]